MVEIMAWRRIGAKPLSEPMLTQIHWCIYAALGEDELTHRLVKISLDNGLFPAWGHAITWTNANML